VDEHAEVSRRRALLTGAALLAVLPPARGAEPELAAAIRAWAGAALPRDGRVTLDIAPLVDNGNAVPVTVRVQSPMSPGDHVTEIVLFNERNPQRDVLRAQLGPWNGRAEVAMRIRLATSQQLVALARMNDGSVWQQRVEVLVTLAACIEGG
jgi:sulfur-oxidizing protein SoxY